MAIKINDIPPEGLTKELDEQLDLSGKGSPLTAVKAALSIRPAGKGIFTVTGRAQAALLLECSRCLRSFSHPVNTEMHFDLAPLSSLGTAAEHELGKGELEIEFYQGDEIDPADLVREQVLINLPMVPLHTPDCKGLCSVCGTDLNEMECGCRKDAWGPFSALNDLLKK
jgi:uncharacterized protein